MPDSTAHTYRVFAPQGRTQVRTVRRPDSTRSLSAEIGECVYAARLPDGLIKIGFTGDLVERLRKLGVNYKSLLAVKAGTYEQEQAIHAKLRSSVAHGQEYYHPTSEVMAVVNEMRQSFGLPAVA